MPFDFPLTETDANRHALERARKLHSLGHSAAVIATALRPYCRSMKARNDVLEFFACNTTLGQQLISFPLIRIPQVGIVVLECV